MPPVEIGPIEDFGVLGAGTAFPPLRVSNLDALRILSSEAFNGRTLGEEELGFLASSLERTLGVRERAWAHRVGEPLSPANEPSTLDLAARAASAALAHAGVAPSALSLVICSTSTPHRMTATVSAGVAASLGITAAAMDIRTGCAGGLFGLATAASFVAMGAEPVLLVGTETFSKVIPTRGAKAAVLSLGDGAGALVLGRKRGGRLEAAHLETDGRLGHLVTTEGTLPPTADQIALGRYALSGEADALTEAVLTRYDKAVGAALRRAQAAPSDVDLFVPHQPSRAVVEAVCRNNDLPLEKTFINVDRHGNIGAAGWVVALAEALAEGRCRSGARVLLAAVGGGMSWAAVSLRW